MKPYNPGWDIVRDVDEETGVTTNLDSHHAGLGVDVRYGFQGYDGWSIHEKLGGGSVVVPYIVKDGKVLIGQVSQNRKLAGGVVAEVPRGFADLSDNDHLDTAVRETAEETGVEAERGRFHLLGSEVNMNSTFFNTSNPDEGVSFFGLQPRDDEVEKFEREDGVTAYRFNEIFRVAAAAAAEYGDKTAERIVKTEFIPLSEAMKSRDGFTLAGVGLLLAHRTQALEHAEVELRTSETPNAE